MVDREDRLAPRFPADKREIAGQAIGELLDGLSVAEDDLGMCGGACGGDLLFADAMLARGADVEIRLPFSERKFVAESVTYAGKDWRELYCAVTASHGVRLLKMPDVLGPPPEGLNAYERLNFWQLCAAFSFGAERVHCVCLWDLSAGSGPGGTRHMYEEVSRRSGHVYLLDTTKLW
jgi:hypothetical protein